MKTADDLSQQFVARRGTKNSGPHLRKSLNPDEKQFGPDEVQEIVGPHLRSTVGTVGVVGPHLGFKDIQIIDQGAKQF